MVLILAGHDVKNDRNSPSHLELLEFRLCVVEIANDDEYQFRYELCIFDTFHCEPLDCH